MARKSTRSSSPKSFRFSEGSSVEARRADIGFQGAWYEAKITRTPRQNLPLYTVRYSTLFAIDSNTPLKASVSLSFMRPRPPIELHSNNVFGLHQLVEAFHNKGWWLGVVSKLPSNGDGLYSVCFPTSREELVFKSLELRRSLEWVKGEWVSIEDYLLDDKEGEHVMFREGTRVEVSRDRENCGAAWFVGTVVKFIGRTYFLVEYMNIKADSESCTEHPLKEIVDLQYIRPCPPMSESTSYNVRDEVEVFYEDGWYFGVVVVILPGLRYVVKYKHREEDMAVHHTSLRPHLVWTDGQWVHVSKDNDKDVADGSDISSRMGKKPGFESGDESSRPLKMMKKVNMLEEHPQFVGEIKSDIRTTRKGKHHASRRPVHLAPVLTSSNDDGEIANKKVGEPSFEEDNSSQPCTTDDTVLIPCGSRSDKVPEIQMVAVGPTGSSLSIVDNVCNEKVSSPIRLPSNMAFDEVEDSRSMLLRKDGVADHSELTLHGSLSERLVVEMEAAPCDTAATHLLPSDDHIGDRHELMPSGSTSFVNSIEETEPLICEVGDNVEGRENKAVVVNNNDRETALADPSPMESSPKKMIFSLSKISEMSELVEPALNISPQQPHFRPLLKCGKELREGLACGLMLAFASLVTDLSNLRILDSEQDFEEKLKVLDYLEKHGFNTQPARARLANLLEIRNLFVQLEEEKNSMGTQVKKLEEVKGNDNLLLSELEKSVVELKERLKCVQGEITNLEACVQATEERTTSVKIQFDALVTAPW